MSINEIAESMVMDRTTTGRAIRPLERDGLVRIGAAEDGRKRVVSLTAARPQARRPRRWKPGGRRRSEFERAFGPEAAKNLRAMMNDVVQGDTGNRRGLSA